MYRKDARIHWIHWMNRELLFGLKRWYTYGAVGFKHIENES